MNQWTYIEDNLTKLIFTRQRDIRGTDLADALALRILLGLANGFLPIGFLQDIEGQLLAALVRDKSLAVELILKTCERTVGGAEIHEDPCAEAAQLSYVVEHD